MLREAPVGVISLCVGLLHIVGISVRMFITHQHLRHLTKSSIEVGSVGLLREADHCLVLGNLRLETIVLILKLLGIGKNLFELLDLVLDMLVVMHIEFFEKILSTPRLMEEHAGVLLLELLDLGMNLLDWHREALVCRVQSVIISLSSFI